MGRSGFLPDKDAALLAWSQNFSTKISATPENFGLSSAQATSYQTLHDGFADALALCDPAVRNKTSCMAKNTAKLALKDGARSLAKIVEGTDTVTDAQKIELGLNVRAMPSPIPAPTSAPDIDIVSVLGRTVKLRLHNSGDPSPKRGRPDGVAGATIFSYVGDAPPEDVNDWKFEGNTTRTVIDVEFPVGAAAGAKVYFTAFWYSARALSGPLCDPVSTVLQYGGVSLVTNVAKAA